MQSIKTLLKLVLPYGRFRLLSVITLIVIQGVVQVVGIASIFPFLSLAANPDKFRSSKIGETLLGLIPDMPNNSLLIASGIGAFGLMLVANLVIVVGQIQMVKYGEGLGHWLRIILLKRITSNSYSYFLAHNSGELLKKATTDVDILVKEALLPALDAMTRFVTSAVLAFTLILIDPRTTTFVGGSLIVFYVILYRVLQKKRGSISARMKNANRGAMREAQQLFAGIKPIKVHNSAPHMVLRYNSYSATRAQLFKWMPFLVLTPRYLVETFVYGAVIGIVLAYSAGGEDLLSLLPKLGLMAFVAYRLLPNIQNCYSSVTRFSVSTHSIEEVWDEFNKEERREFFDDHNTLSASPLQWNHSIKFEEISFRYPTKDSYIFDRFSLTISKNQFIALVGPSGCGKSTLVDLLLGLYTPEAGQIMIDNKRLSSDQMGPWRSSIGYVPQEIFLLDDSIIKNIAFGLPDNEINISQVSEAAHLAQIDSFIENELPEGYHTIVGERGARLSGGQKQRIGLARALYHKPTTLILDEATSALDTKVERDLVAALNRLRDAFTIIAIAHRPTTIEAADLVIDLGP